MFAEVVWLVERAVRQSRLVGREGWRKACASIACCDLSLDVLPGDRLVASTSVS